MDFRTYSVASQRFSLLEVIEKLTSPDQYDMEFTKVFLMLYKKLITAQEFLESLFDRFELMPNSFFSHGNHNIVQLRVCNVLIHWLQTYPEDFESERLRLSLTNFINGLEKRKGFVSVHRKLQVLVNQLNEKEPHDEEAILVSPTLSTSSTELSPICEDSSTEVNRISPGMKLKPTSFASFRSMKASFRMSRSVDTFKDPSEPCGFMDFDDHILAQEFCVIESDIFQKIKVRRLRRAHKKP
jgi:hypothetical protein